MGGAEGSVARSVDQAAGHARRGSPDRVRHVRRRHPLRLRRRHRDALGPWHVDAGSRRRRRGVEEGRPQVHAGRLQAEGILGARPHQRRAMVVGRRRSLVAADQASRRLGRRRRHRRVRAAQREERGRLRRHPLADNPDIWQSQRPAQGGEAGAMFEKIIARALEMRSDRADRSNRPEAGQREEPFEERRPSWKDVCAEEGSSVGSEHRDTRDPSRARSCG